MDKIFITQQALKFKKTRSNLLAVVAFTAINLILIAFNAGFYFPFSATAPGLIFEVGRGMAEELQRNVFLIAGLIIAFIVVALYFVCWLLTKRLRGFILAALILFSLDSLMFLAIVFAAGFEISYLLDIAFHGWVLFYLINGVVAWAKLRGVNADDFNAALEPSAPAEVNQPPSESLGDQTATDNETIS